MVPELPSLHAFAVMAFVALALYLFATDRYGIPTIGLGVVLALALGFYVFPYPGLKPVEFFANFGNEALVTVCTILLMVKGLEATGALEPLTRLLSRHWQRGRAGALPLTLVLAAACSGFVNDTPLMAILFPLVLASAARGGAAPSRVLLPLNYAVLIGGMATTIGTSTNVLALGVAHDLGVGPFALFDFAGAALTAGGLGLLFVWLVGPRLLPERRPTLAEEARRIFTAVLSINRGSYAEGRMLSEVLSRTGNRMRVDRIQRDDDLTVAKLPNMTLRAGDRLFVRDSAARLKEYEKLLGATLFNAGDLQRPVSESVPLDTSGQRLVEVVITRGSPLYQRVLEVSDFVYRYRLLPLALHRGGLPEASAEEMEQARLRAGDVILAQGTAEAVRELKATGSMLVLDGVMDLPRTDRAPIALLILAAFVVVSALGLMPVVVGALLGVALMLLTRCLQWRHIPETINTSLVMVMVSSLCLATALIRTGAADWVASTLVEALPAVSAPVMLGAVMLAVTALTNFVTNNAAAAVAVPVAVGIARAMGAPAEAFVVGVIFAANMPFATPFGYQTNALIMSAGGYSAADFARIGIPLTAIMLPALVVALSSLYGLG